MSSDINLRVLGGGQLQAAAAALAQYGQPDLEQNWAFMAPEHGTRLENREF